MVSYSAEIIALPQSDDSPLWESFGHHCVEDAYKAGEEHIHFVRPKDRITFAAGDGRYREGGTCVWNVFDAGGAPVAALIVSEEGPGE